MLQEEKFLHGKGGRALEQAGFPPLQGLKAVGTWGQGRPWQCWEQLGSMVLEALSNPNNSTIIVDETPDPSLALAGQGQLPPLSWQHRGGPDPSSRGLSRIPNTFPAVPG